MENKMSPERQIHHDTLEAFEDKLTNGHRGEIKDMSDHLVALSRSQRVILRTDFVTPTELSRFCYAQHKKLRFGWPGFASVVFVTVAVVGLIFKFAPQPKETNDEIHHNTTSGHVTY